MQDINFSVEQDRFNFRVTAFITCGNKVLLQKGGQVSFYNMVGGRVKMGESTTEAIVREVKEELGLDIETPKLLSVYENFFDWQGKHVQELTFIYHFEINEVFATMLDGNKVIDSEDEYLKLVNIKDLDSLECKPEIIYTLNNLPKNQISHIIQK